MRHQNSPNAYSLGFSLIELLIVIAIIGILAAFALPGYLDSRIRTNRADGKAALLQTSAVQERFYSANNRYSTNADPLSNPVQVTVDSDNGNYIITVAACGVAANQTIINCFLATATPQGAQADDECANLTLTSTGLKGSSAGVAADCWQR